MSDEVQKVETAVAEVTPIVEETAPVEAPSAETVEAIATEAKENQGDAVAQNGDDSSGQTEQDATEATEKGTTEAATEKGTTEAATEKDVTEATDKDESKEVKPTTSGDILKTKAKQDYKDISKNLKFDPSVLPDSSDPDEIRKQVEFYFSDSNLAHDKFLWTQVGGAENKPIKLSIVHSFKRMRRFKPFEAVVAALRESNVLDVTGEAGEEMIVRKKAYDPSRGNTAMQSSVYVKGFGDEEPDTQIKLEEFFRGFGLEVNSVRLRRTDVKLFKGSVFVEFANPEEAKKFLELDPKPKWQDHDLKIMSKIDYCEEKNEQIRAGLIKPSDRPAKFYEGKEGGSRGGRGNSRGGNNFNKRGDGDRRDGGGRGRGGRGRGRDSGRGRGRGARGGSRGGFRDRRDGDKEAQKQQREPPTVSNGNDVKPIIHSSAPATTNGKRAHDGDGSGQEPPAKKVDTGAAS